VPGGAVLIRAAGPGEWDAIGRVRRESWGAAYRGLLPGEVIEAATAPDVVARLREFAAGPGRITLVAETGTAVVGFASFGPERLPRGGADRKVPRAELYAIYVLPQHWSTGAGRALLAQVVAHVRGSRYASIALWVLEGNTRARRFYERAGFVATGERQTGERHGDVAEMRYVLELAAAG
jgi:ribosomal protein S18 acetylase RimI-like enzyme